MHRKNFLQVVGLSLAAVALPKVATAKTTAEEYIPVTHWQFRNLVYASSVWAAQGEGGRDSFLVRKCRFDNPRLLDFYFSSQSFKNRYCLPGYKVVHGYYRGVHIDYPSGRYLGNHIFIVREDFKMPPQYNPRFAYMCDLEYERRIRPLGKYLKYEPTTTIKFKP